MSERRPGTPLLEDAIWIALLERYVRGETSAALAREYGVSVWAIAWQARNRGYRKMDRPDAVYRWRQPPPIAAHETRAEALAFAFRADDPEGSARAALEKAEAAAAEGRVEDCLRLNEMARSAMRTGRALRAGLGGNSGGAVGPLHPPSGGPVVGSHAILSPPPRGEEGSPLILRTAQRAPLFLENGGDWSTWLFLGGRGAGKTLAGASWISDMAERCGRLALVGATLHDAREVMIGGPSGILGLPRWRAGGDWPVYQASRRRLVFPNGAEAFVFSAEDPDSLRGPQFAAAWADEFCAWRNGGEVLALLRMGLRLTGSGAPGANARLAEPRCLSAPDEDQAAEVRWIPRLVVTTTPRPTAALRALRAEASCVETHAGTQENAANLAPAFLDGLEALYGGTRRAAQELEGLVVEPEGGLFTAEMLARARMGASPSLSEGGWPERSEGRVGATAQDGLCVASALPTPSLREDPPPEGEGEARGRFDKVVVAVDPTTTAAGNACGIVVVARSRLRGNDEVSTAVVLADRSVGGLGPEGWARRALQAAADFGATELVAEVNQGGEMVRSVLDAVGFARTGLLWRPVRATTGKRARAEPVAALYEQGRVRHAGTFARLEEELMAFGSEDEGKSDLDRADALVWGVTALLLGARGEGPRVRSLDRGWTSRGLSNPVPWPGGPWP